MTPAAGEPDGVPPMARTAPIPDTLAPVPPAS